jgi:hypothetical protein
MDLFAAVYKQVTVPMFQKRRHGANCAMDMDANQRGSTLQFSPNSDTDLETGASSRQARSGSMP